MLKRLETLFERIEATPLNLASWFTALFAIIGVRVAIELYFEDIQFRFADHFFYQFTHHYLIFILIYLTSLPIIVWFARVTIKQAALILLFGFLIIWTPPIVDEIMSRGDGLWSFYAFDSPQGLVERYVTFFGDKPEVGITYGVRFEIGSVLLLMALYVWVKTRRFWRMLCGVLALYTTLFIIGVFPSLITFALLAGTQGVLSVTELDVARLMLSPEPLYLLNPPNVSVVLALKMGLIYSALLPWIITGLLALYFRPLLVALWRNLRLPQVIFHLGLFILGVGLVFLHEGKAAFELNWLHAFSLPLLAYAVVLAWITSVIANDLHDTRIDTITNPKRPLITGIIHPDLYRTIGFITFGGSIFFAALISTQLAFLMLLYQAIAWLYSVPPLRLKRFPGIASLLASSACLLIFFGGYIVFSVEKNISELPGAVTLLLFLAYTALLPIKDFRDIPGDRADGVITLPVLWGEAKAKRIIGTLAFLCFIASPFILDVRHLFPVAFFFGSMAYWLLQVSSPSHRTFSYARMSGWYIALVSGYVTLLAWHFLSR